VWLAHHTQKCNYPSFSYSRVSLFLCFCSRLIFSFCFYFPPTLPLTKKLVLLPCWSFLKKKKMMTCLPASFPNWSTTFCALSIHNTKQIRERCAEKKILWQNIFFFFLCFIDGRERYKRWKRKKNVLNFVLSFYIFLIVFCSKNIFIIY